MAEPIVEICTLGSDSFNGDCTCKGVILVAEVRTECEGGATSTEACDVSYDCADITLV